MEEILRRIEHVQHLVPECINCAFNKYSGKYPEDAPREQQIEYMQRVMTLLAQAEISTAIPVIIRDIDNLRIEMFGSTDDYSEIKKHFNEMLLEQMDSFRERIREAADPLKLAMQLALVGNYIDFGVVAHVDEAFLNQLLAEAEGKSLDQDTYIRLKNDLADAGKLVYVTDNCGEIVMDRLLIELISSMYPQLTISVVVRGMDTMNDATMEDADQVGLTSMDQIERVVGNGNNIMGTWFPEISEEAADELRSADLVIAKGQANFETMRRCGLNVYYLFLCKCDLYANMFGVPKLSGMLINDSDPRNQG
ncbi:MAG: DUF89 family protein [Eubacterium sp.]|nr:DUF89 family protein [Eubacterium sp.]